MAEVSRTEKLKAEAVVEMCDLGHYFLKLADHPKKHNWARCPYCMAVGLDAAFVRIGELEMEVDSLNPLHDTSRSGS